MADNQWHLLAACCLALLVTRVLSTQEVLKKLTIGFGKVLSECKTELSMGDHIMQDFTNYWKEDYELLNRDFGCMVICMASKHNLITDVGVHHENAHEFAKKHGADDDTAKQIITILHDCEGPNSSQSDDCLRALEVSKCFRTKIHELKWAPSMEEIIEEIMTDDIMKKLSSGFSRALDECKDELNIGDHIMRDFENYWQEDYQLLNRDFGCMVMCMAGKHKILTSSGLGIHHDSAHEFAKKHGADDDTAKQLATILTECESAAVGASDKCVRALEVSKCFRTKIHELKWAPTIDQIIEEVLTNSAGEN